MARSGVGEARPDPGPEPGGPPSRPPNARRTRGQRLTVAAAIVTTVLCFAAAGGLVVGQHLVEQRQTVSIESPSERDHRQQQRADRFDEAPTETAPSSTFPPADPHARNFLITGVDNGSCIDPDSPFAGGFGDRSDMGERSDTIMIWRIDPSSSRAAILSLPRDLWVTISNTGSQGRINSAYRLNDPQNLIDTLWDNFGIGIDHFIQVDFCAFMELVDAVGGVAVPFEYPTRDRRSGLNVTEPGCYTFDGEHALAYVRSRYYEVLPPGGDPNDSQAWERDRTSDLGRMTRQQDFTRRLLASVLDRGLLNPSVVTGLYRALTEHIVTDTGLSLNRILEFAGVAQAIDPEVIPSYQFLADDAEIGGAQVLIPRPEAEGMPEVLALFRGEKSLQPLPDSVPERPSDAGTAGDGGQPSNGDGDGAGPPSTADPGPPSMDPEASRSVDATTESTVADSIQRGIFPDPAVVCG